jgi:hypothetical protein
MSQFIPQDNNHFYSDDYTNRVNIRGKMQAEIIPILNYAAGH